MSARVTIARLGFQGDGIAEGPVYVPRTLPGEVVEGEVSKSRMEAPRIVTPSSDRVAAPCRHYRSCGGCAVQHASDDFVANWKRDIVRTALIGQGLDVPEITLHTSPPRTRRRAAFSGRRTKKGALVGFHGRASGTITEIPDCLLVHPGILAARPALEALVMAGGSRKGELSLTVTLCDAGPDVAVRSGKSLDAPAQMQLAQVVEQHNLSRLSWDGEVVAQRTQPVVRFDGIAVTPPPGAFLQATEDGEIALREVVTGIVRGADRVVDLFAGCGTFALPLARSAAVHGVEGEAEMIEALQAGWRHATGLKAVTGEVRDLFRRPLLRDELNRFDAVVLDPPRAGAEAQIAEIVASGVPCVAYVSCNPVTFARDAATLLRNGFEMRKLAVIDQFRWSTHVEIAAEFRRA